MVVDSEVAGYSSDACTYDWLAADGKEQRAGLPEFPCYNFLFPVAKSAEDRIDKRFIRTNDRIRAREIRVIGDEGEQIGVMSPFEALKLAKSKNLDLVEISPTAHTCTSRKKKSARRRNTRRRLP